MKILLINPPTKHTSGAARPSVSLPLGLLYIAAVLEQRAYNVDIYDSRMGAKIEENNESESSYIHVDDSWETIEKEIDKRNPDIVGIPNLFTAQLPYAIRVAEAAKKVKTNSVVVMGGNLDYIGVHFSLIRKNDY